LRHEQGRGPRPDSLSITSDNRPGPGTCGRASRFSTRPASRASCPSLRLPAARRFSGFWVNDPMADTPLRAELEWIWCEVGISFAESRIAVTHDPRKAI